MRPEREIREFGPMLANFAQGARAVAGPYVAAAASYRRLPASRRRASPLRLSEPANGVNAFTGFEIDDFEKRCVLRSIDGWSIRPGTSVMGCSGRQWDWARTVVTSRTKQATGRISRPSAQDTAARRVTSGAALAATRDRRACAFRLRRRACDTESNDTVRRRGRVGRNPGRLRVRAGRGSGLPRS